MQMYYLKDYGKENDQNYFLSADLQHIKYF